MFELAAAIREWRARYEASGSFSSQQIDELQDHLHEQVGQLKTTGLSDEEAFLVAAHRLGDVNILAPEYENANPAVMRQRKMVYVLFGALVAYALPVSFSFILDLFYHLLLAMRLDGMLVFIVPALIELSIIGLVCWMGYRFLTGQSAKSAEQVQRMFRWAVSSKINAIMVFLCFIVLAVLNRFLMIRMIKMPRINEMWVTMRGAQTMIYYVFIPLALLLILLVLVKRTKQIKAVA